MNHSDLEPRPKEKLYVLEIWKLVVTGEWRKMSGWYSVYGRNTTSARRDAASVVKSLNFTSPEPKWRTLDQKTGKSVNPMTMPKGTKIESRRKLEKFLQKGEYEARMRLYEDPEDDTLDVI